ncbi:hypothetical protein F1C10_11210 [Sphingomonas sp. NBWT7]|uniref:hypothetical protein n=1 Tax=Sphingomonas sp. NBWT7 TaxID=2596913 RepID=UPI0016293ACC|nr:hypothetical protein [Sphingomonas sp. NBWT7]QNE32455.1 hypothetical protein F1C10_11210 [Sphingomonas sp. NBWT7]
MDTNDEDLVELLLARVGALLEDASAVAVLQEQASVSQRVTSVAAAIDQARLLAEAAATLSQPGVT